MYITDQAKANPNIGETMAENGQQASSPTSKKVGNFDESRT